MQETYSQVSKDIRSLRKLRGLSLTSLAQKINRSVGWLSQIERGISRPSLDDLKAISQTLDIPVSMLFDNIPGPEIERGYIVRKKNRRTYSPFEGLVEELISPDLTDNFEVVLSIHEAGASLPETKIRQTQEVVYLISGRLDLVIAGRAFKVSAGDSFRIRGEAFTWANPYERQATALWIVSPPIY